MMSRARPRRVAGISALEVLIATVVAALLGFSAVILLTQGNHEAMVSEDYMFAEALAQRHLAEAMSRTFNSLEDAGLPLTIPLTGIPKEDRTIAKVHTEYGRNLDGPAVFSGELEIREVRPGLIVYEVSLSWPVSPRSRTLRRYNLIRLRTRKDLAVSTNFELRTLDPDDVGGAV